ncbi:hypothetical protein Trydic_g8134 [Trypoxylus dichotomus]
MIMLSKFALGDFVGWLNAVVRGRDEEDEKESSRSSACDGEEATAIEATWDRLRRWDVKEGDRERRMDEDEEEDV